MGDQTTVTCTTTPTTTTIPATTTTTVHAETRQLELKPIASFEFNPFAASVWLKEYGPWAVCVVLFIAIYLLYRSMDKRLEKMAAVFERSQKQFITLIDKMTRRQMSRKGGDMEEPK